MESDSDTVGIINAVSVDIDNEVGVEEKVGTVQWGISRSRFLEPIVFLICFAFNLNGEFPLLYSNFTRFRFVCRKCFQEPGVVRNLQGYLQPH